MINSRISNYVVSSFAVIVTFWKRINTEVFEKLKDAIKGVPKLTLMKEINFFRNNDKQLEFLTNFDKVLQTSLKCTVAKDACITPLPNFDAGFYIDDGNYNLYLDQNGADINIRLTRWAKQDVDPNSAKTETPVTATVLKNAKLCIIKDASANRILRAV